MLDELLGALCLEQLRMSVERSVANYYASLSDVEIREQAEWGAFAMRELLSAVHDRVDDDSTARQ